ncbi:MAG: hypothetical protein H3C34_24690 [Caldilineaceae bacterium]|nr:hypothetical protein [Caldilineaceae bacterium]
MIEAKIGRREDFHIRQLYYPFLEWSSRSRKRVVPVLLVVTNGKFYFTEFGFNRDFGDLSLVRTACYVINETPVAQIRLSTLLAHVDVEQEPDVPFPQANDLDKVVDLIALIDANPAGKSAIAEHFEFDDRQGDYYANAAVYLGFAQRSRQGFVVTEAGSRFIGTRSLSRRTQILVEQMLKRPVFRDCIQLLLARELRLDAVSSKDVAGIIARHTPLSGSTPPRRASTVLRWLKWVQDNCEILP